MTVSVTKSVNIGGRSFGEQQSSIVAEAELIREVSFNPAVAATASRAGSLTTRTDDDTGVITLAAGMGALFVATDRVDLYWDIGGVKGHRRGMKVSSVAGDLVTVGTGAGDVGVGDVLPAAASAIIIAKSVVRELRFDGSDLVALQASAEGRGIVVLTGDDDIEDHFYHFPLAGQTDGWYKDSGAANPVTGDVITKAYMSSGDAAAVKKVKVGAAFN